MGVCDDCGKGGITQKCGRCGIARYCDKVCQKRSWRKHKIDCMPFVLKESPGKGLGLFSTKKLKLGEVVIDEYPIMICNSNYETHLIPEKFRALTKMEKDKVLSFYGGNNETSEENQAIKIFGLNRIAVTSKDNRTALYPTISRINHSCLPNVVWSYKQADEVKKQVHVIREIAPGEEIVASYLDITDNFDTKLERQLKLLPRGFQCSCELCSAPNADSDFRRMKIKEHHDKVQAMFTRCDMKKAVYSAFEKCRLMESCDEFVFDLPGAYLELYEVIVVSKVTGVTVNYNQMGIERNEDVYREKALSLYKRFGNIELLKLIYYNKKMIQIADRYGVRNDLWV